MQASFQAGRELSQSAIPLVRDELSYRLQQQSLLGEFGRIAMQTRDFRQILQRATELCAEGLQARFAKVLEYFPEEHRLMVRAGVGTQAPSIWSLSRPTSNRQQDSHTRRDRPSYQTT